MLTFKHLLLSEGIASQEVRLLRHQDSRYPGQPSPFVMWRDDLGRFNDYQSTQDLNNAAKPAAPTWASFVGLPGNQTLFVGLYDAVYQGPSTVDRLQLMTGALEQSGSIDCYALTPKEALSDYIGRIWIEWGAGYRSWIRRADSKPKPILEITRTFDEPKFPGFSNFIRNLSELETMPKEWVGALRSNKGIYLLTCPRTFEQYVGMASGEDGFLGRWQEYALTGHGGNVALKSREPSDYQVSILETAKPDASYDDISALEILWKLELRSREMGLNRN